MPRTKPSPKKLTKNPLVEPRKFSWKVFVLVAVLLIAIGYLIVRLTYAAKYDGWQRVRVVNVAASQVGQTEFSPQVLQYTEGNRESWCADFVSWVYANADVPFVTAPGAGRSSWRIPLAWARVPGVPNLRDYFIANGTWQPANSSYLPSPGDVIIFGDAESHTGIVEKVDRPANKEPQIYTIEGNTGGSNPNAPGSVPVGDKVMRKQYGKSNPQISGYGTIVSTGPAPGAKYTF